MSDDADLLRWLGLVEQAYKIARHDRSNELRGRRVKRYDARGLHPYSEAWGLIGAATTTEIHDRLLEAEEIVSPSRLREVAERDAEREFAEDIRAGRWPPDADALA